MRVPHFRSMTTLSNRTTVRRLSALDFRTSLTTPTIMQPLDRKLLSAHTSPSLSPESVTVTCGKLSSDYWTRPAIGSEFALTTRRLESSRSTASSRVARDYSLTPWSRK